MAIIANRMAIIANSCYYCQKKALSLGHLQPTGQRCPHLPPVLPLHPRHRRQPPPSRLHVGLIHSDTPSLEKHYLSHVPTKHLLRSRPTHRCYEDLQQESPYTHYFKWRTSLEAHENSWPPAQLHHFDITLPNLIPSRHKQHIFFCSCINGQSTTSLTLSSSSCWHPPTPHLR